MGVYGGLRLGDAVQAVIGHTNPAMTRHDLHADQKNVKQAVFEQVLRLTVGASTLFLEEPRVAII